MTLDRDGWDLIPRVYSPEACDELVRLLPPVPPGTAGTRDLHTLPEMSAIATRSPLSRLATEVLGQHAQAVRILYFDKQPGSNWKLPYHQDLTICVDNWERRHPARSRANALEITGYGPWSVKEGHHHVQPPVEVLEQMIAVRLHLDPCDRSNGALRVIPGSHCCGRLTGEEIDHLVKKGPEELVEAGKGDAILMRPLLLHASSPSEEPTHRRVLHIEYCAATLPEPLRWLLGWPC